MASQSIDFEAARMIYVICFLFLVDVNFDPRMQQNLAKVDFFCFRTIEKVVRAFRYAIRGLFVDSCLNALKNGVGNVKYFQ